MADRVTITLAQKVTLSVEHIAHAFCEMDDDAQAQFFVHVARIQGDWPAHARVMQRHYIGRHLAECTCVTDEARELVTDIYESMTLAAGEEKPDAG